MMQTDVKPFDLSSGGGDFMEGRVRIKGVTLTYNGDGMGYFVIYWDEGYYYVDVPNMVGNINILLPGEGIRTGEFSAYEAFNCSATVYYG